MLSRGGHRGFKACVFNTDTMRYQIGLMIAMNKNDPVYNHETVLLGVLGDEFVPSLNAGLITCIISSSLERRRHILFSAWVLVWRCRALSVRY